MSTDMSTEKPIPRGCHDLLQTIRRATKKGASLEVADLRRVLGYSHSTMHFRVQNLENAGHIRVLGEKHAPKIVELLEPGVMAARRMGTPIYGCIRAGEPALVENTPNDVIESWDDFLPSGEQFFVSFADGDSMNGDGILKGDAVLLLRCESLMWVPEGTIAAVAVDEAGCATLKRVHFETAENGERLVRLCASNPEYADRIVSIADATVAGIYIGLVRLVQGWSRK